jgi:hypothetical protein
MKILREFQFSWIEIIKLFDSGPAVLQRGGASESDSIIPQKTNFIYIARSIMQVSTRSYLCVISVLRQC